MVTSRPTHYRKADLTPRQREVLALLAKGHTNAEIADRLDISLDGAKYHVSEVITRLNVDSREEAADWWREQNSVSHRIRALLAVPALKWAAAGVAAAGAGIVAVVVLAVPQDDTPAPLSTTATPAPVAIAESWGQGVPLSDGLRWAFITGGVGNRDVVLGSESDPNRVIGLSGAYSTPALSPDGRWLAVTDSDDVESFIHVLDTVSGQGLRLAILADRYPGPPEWSRDSQRVAVATPDGLFIVDTAGVGHYTHQAWPNYTRPFTWSPDGQHLAVSTEEGFFILDGTGNRVASQLSTHGHPLDGECIGFGGWSGNVSRQIKPGEYPWSPDSRRVVATMGTALVVLGVDGSKSDVPIPAGTSGHLRKWSGDSIVTEGGLYSESPAAGWHWTSAYTPRVQVDPSYTDEEEQVLAGLWDSPENVIRADVLGVDGGRVLLSHRGSEILAGAYTNSGQGEVRLLDVPDRMATLWDDWHGGGRSASFVLVDAPAVVLVP